MVPVSCVDAAAGSCFVLQATALASGMERTFAPRRAGAWSTAFDMFGCHCDCIEGTTGSISNSAQPALRRLAF